MLLEVDGMALQRAPLLDLDYGAETLASARCRLEDGWEGLNIRFGLHRGCV